MAEVRHHPFSVPYGIMALARIVKGMETTQRGAEALAIRQMPGGLVHPAADLQEKGAVLDPGCGMLGRSKCLFCLL
jgi:hypothetical protein